METWLNEETVGNRTVSLQIVLIKIKPKKEGVVCERNNHLLLCMMSQKAEMKAGG